MKLVGWIAYDTKGQWVGGNARDDVMQGEHKAWVIGHDVTIQKITITIPSTESEEK